MNFPRNYSNMAGPRMFPGPRRGLGPYFPTYNRSRVDQDFVFAENPDLHGNNFWVGPVASKDTTRKVFPPTNQKNHQNEPFVPKQLPKVVEKEPAAPKNPEEKKTTETPKDATNNPQNQEAISQPQSSGAPCAAKRTRRRKMNSVRKRARKAKAAANNLQNHEATSSQAQNSGVTKSAQQPIPAGGSQPHNSKADAAGKVQQPVPKNISVKPEATNSLQPNPPRVNQPENAEVEQQEMANPQNGDSGKRDAAEVTRDADLPSPPHKRWKMEETVPPQEQVDLVNKYGLRGDTSAMYSCDLCQYHTLDEKLIQIHFLTYKHRMVLQHLWSYFPKKRVKYLNQQLVSKMKKSLGQKKNDVNLVANVFTQISPTHYLHRIEATHCETCGILIPDVPDLLLTHIQSISHKQNLQVKFQNLKTNSIRTAKQLMQDFYRQKEPKMAQYSPKVKEASSAQGQRSSKYKAASSAQGQRSSKYKAASSAQTPPKAPAASSSKASSTLEILVPEEDDDAEPNGEEFPVNNNEGSVDGKKDCDNMGFEPDPITDGKVKEDETEEAAEAP